MAKYDIFISYRREGGYDTAKHLYDLLTRDGYRVSFDIDTLRNGDFDKSLLNRIDECKDFILIVDAHAFDRTLDPRFNPQNDWLRQELAYALKKGKNIIPIFLNGITGFPSNLPSDIKGVSKKNGPEFSRYYFNDFYKKLKDNFITSTTNSTIKYLVVSSLVALSVILLIYLFVDNHNINPEYEPDELLVPDTIISSETTTIYENESEATTDELKTAKPFHPFMRFFGPDDFVIGGNIFMEADSSPIQIKITFNQDGDKVTGGYIYYTEWDQKINITSGYQNPREEPGLILLGDSPNCDNVRIEISYVGEGCYDGIIDECNMHLPFKAE